MQDGLLYQQKLVPSSFQVNVARNFVQCQNHRSELYNPTSKISKQQMLS